MAEIHERDISEMERGEGRGEERKGFVSESHWFIQ